MPKVRVKLNGAEVRNGILKSPGAAGICMGIAQQRAEAAGPGYAARQVSYPERTGAIVYPETPAAMRDNYRNNTLEKMRGGRG